MANDMFPTSVQSVGSDAFTVYDTHTVQKAPIGMRYVDPDDGRVFRYCKATTGGVYPGYGAFCKSTVGISEVIHANAAIGDTYIRIAEASITADQFAGGLLVVGHGSSARTQNRRVVSNTASDATTTHVDFYLDRPLTVAVTTADYCEVMPNIYSQVACGASNEYHGVVCVPAAIAATGEYFWGQTWGPCWICPGGAGTPGSTAAERTVYFVGDGTINGDVGFGAPTTEPERRQVAGFILQVDSSGSGGPPFVMLQISP